MATGLPDDPVAAATAFYADIVPDLRAAPERPSLAVLFSPADHSHAAWRLAAIQQLARDAAPATRVNAVVVNPADEEGTAEVIRFALTAPGITGQIIEVANTAKAMASGPESA